MRKVINYYELYLFSALEQYFNFSSESVGEGQPDKLCDQISDALVDACLAVDPDSILGMEAVAKGDLIVLLGEITMKNREKVDATQIARDVCKDVGYDSIKVGLDYKSVNIVENIPCQSQEITDAIRDKKGTKEDLLEI